MSLLPLRGILVEYGGAFLGPIPNVVVFQFNPEQIARRLTIAGRRTAPEGAGAQPQREVHATPAPPVESFTITAHFSAADDLAGLAPIQRLFGIGPQIAALEKMVYPPATPGGLLGAAIDAVGAALSGSGKEAATAPRPRERVPRILFIWGATRVLPVSITSMSITEQKYDVLLNPVQAEVQIGLDVAAKPPDDDPIAQGALKYTTLLKDTQATLNLTKAIEYAVDLIPF